MEVLVAVIGFAGALLAAVGTGALVGRLRGEPAGWLIAWVVATVALCLSLGVVATGHLIGFGPVTFRLYQLTGALLAPVWLAIGTVQLLARKAPARFVTWLAGIAFTVVASVILLFDPVGGVAKFGTSLPLGAEHWDWPPTYLLTAAHAVTALVLVGSLAIAGLRYRDGDDYDADNLHATLVLVPTGIALVGAVRFAIPAIFVTVLLTATAAGIWYTLLRPLAPYEDEEDEIDSEDRVWERAPQRRRDPGPDADRRPAPARDGQPGPARQPARHPSEPPGPVVRPPAQPRRSGLGDLVAEYRAGEQEVDYAARMQPGTDFGGPSTGYIISQGDDRAGSRRDDAPREHPRQNREFGVTAMGAARMAQVGPEREFGVSSGGGRRARPGPPDQEFGMPVAEAAGHVPQGDLDGGIGGAAGGAAGRRPQEAPGAFTPPAGRAGGRRAHAAPEPDFGPATGALFSATELARVSGEPAAAPRGLDESVRPSPSIYGLLTVFTLLDGAGEAFDRLAEETVEAVRRGEPDTLIYACHAVKSAPLQRIVYELYRDEVAYHDHQRQPHMERFVGERQALVLATNVIELNVNVAKVVPLPTAFRL
jgi:quinol monooxygenase YgiN